ncbi:MAG: response regulator [Rhodospirillales bacterium]
MTKRVLIAEDEPNIVESLTFILERAGFEVGVTTTGRQALVEAQAKTPDILILDVMLPEMDGYEVLRQLRADPRTKTLPILMLTAKGQREDRETAISCGADMFVTKPFVNSDLIAAVNSLAGDGTA